MSVYLLQVVKVWKPGCLLCMFLGEKPDFAWVPPEKIKHYQTARSECLPSKKEKKYKNVMAALQIADQIHTDPRDLSAAQADRILSELDKLVQHNVEFVVTRAARLERLVAAPQDAQVARASLPIWARE